MIIEGDERKGYDDQRKGHGSVPVLHAVCDG